MLKRVRDWVQARIDAAILPVVKRCVADVAEPIDYERLAVHVTTLKEFMREVRERLEQDLSDEDMAQRVAEHIDASDVASYMDAADVASHVEVDSSDIDMDEVAEKINYRDLCRCLLAELKKEGV